MSGWLGAMNYGVIVANEVDALLMKSASRRQLPRLSDPCLIRLSSNAMSLEEIQAAIPHREPFLLVDEIVERTRTASSAARRFTPTSSFSPGHYPEFPLTPGVLLCEAAMQAGAVLLASIVPARSACRWRRG